MADVQQVRLNDVLASLQGGCIVAVDVAKAKFAVGLATWAGEIVQLFRFEHPVQTGTFLQLVEGLRAGVPPGKLKVALEPTGTYGDALRFQLHTRQVPIFLVSPKRTHDSQELFDGVPSLHDAKSAALIAKLCALGLATPDQPELPARRQLRALVEQRSHEQEHREQCLGRMEGLLARHWPEFAQWLDVRESVSALRLLAQYGSPARVHRQAEEAKQFLQSVSRGQLSREQLEGTVQGARTTLGVPMVPQEEDYLRQLAAQALESMRKMEALEEQMLAFRTDETFARLQPWMGTFTAAALVTLCPPQQYANAAELEKACGLNLREKSSGEHQGRLSITKRGPGLVRQLLFLFALRMIRRRRWRPGTSGAAVTRQIRRSAQSWRSCASWCGRRSMWREVGRSRRACFSMSDG
jgi:transposase